ncbi:hypothetical protein [Amycolatopsis nigrescens]|nr:hypothetical protein [Amycolatopsis nigrescens]
MSILEVAGGLSIALAALLSWQRATRWPRQEPRTPITGPLQQRARLDRPD